MNSESRLAAWQRHVAALAATCRAHHLEGVEILDGHTDEELAAIYNGLGPDAFPRWIRFLITVKHPRLEPAALIHDLEWDVVEHLPPGDPGRSREAFEASNARFRRNCLKVIRETLPWWHPLRLRLVPHAYLFAWACGTRWGWRSWRA